MKQEEWHPSGSIPPGRVPRGQEQQQEQLGFHPQAALAVFIDIRQILGYFFGT